jgi:hypothetical protein
MLAKKTLVMASASLLLASMTALSQIPAHFFKTADAATCTPANHCYAQEEISSVTNYGNKYRTIISDLTLSDYCNNFITVEQWVGLPNGDWLEMGTMVGKNPVSGTCHTTEKTFSAKRVSGVYSETTHSSVTIGNTYIYELSDTNKDKTWRVLRGGTELGTMTSPYANGIGVTVGAETTVDSGLPKTHIWDIAWYKSTNVWEFWDIADFFGEIPSNNPLWIINCTPNYTHVHVGSGTVGDCT